MGYATWLKHYFDLKNDTIACIYEMCKSLGILHIGGASRDMRNPIREETLKLKTDHKINIFFICLKHELLD